MIPKQIRQQIKTVKFYTYTNPLVNNIFTTCIFITPDNQLLARGVSICSMLDQHSTKKGKNQAFGRALKATINQKTTEEIKRHTPTKTISKTFKFPQKEHRAYFWEFIYCLTVEPIEPAKFVNIHNNKYLLIVQMPEKYTVNQTLNFFTHKSSYLPTPTKGEIQFINNTSVTYTKGKV